MRSTRRNRLGEQGTGQVDIRKRLSRARRGCRGAGGQGAGSAVLAWREHWVARCRKWTSSVLPRLISAKMERGVNVHGPHFGEQRDPLARVSRRGVRPIALPARRDEPARPAPARDRTPRGCPASAPETAVLLALHLSAWRMQQRRKRPSLRRAKRLRMQFEAHLRCRADRDVRRLRAQRCGVLGTPRFRAAIGAALALPDARGADHPCRNGAARMAGSALPMRRSKS